MLNQCPFFRGRVAIVGERHFKAIFGNFSFQFTYSIPCYLDDVAWSLMPLPKPKTRHLYIHKIHIYIYISLYITYSRFCQRKQSMFPNMEPSPPARWGLRSYFAEAVSENVTVPPETSLENFTHWLLGKPRRGWFGVYHVGKTDVYTTYGEWWWNWKWVLIVWPTLPHYLILMWQSHEASLK
jgi:hypothetical protein